MFYFNIFPKTQKNDEKVNKLNKINKILMIIRIIGTAFYIITNLPNLSCKPMECESLFQKAYTYLWILNLI